MIRLLSFCTLLALLFPVCTPQALAQPDLPPSVAAKKYTQRTLSVSPDGRLIAEISRTFGFAADKLLHDSAGTQVKLWDVATGQVKWVKQSTANVYAQGGFSPDGKKFICYGGYSPPQGEDIVGNHNRFNLWDIETGQGPDSLELEEQETLVQLAFTPDSKALVGTSIVYVDNLTAVRMWDAANGKLLRTVEDFPTPNETMLWPTRGNWLVTSSNTFPGREKEDDWIRVLSLPDLRLLHSLNAGKELTVLLALSPDGKKLAYKPYTPPGEEAMSDRIHLWDIETNAVSQVTFPDLESFGVFSLNFSPDGQTLIGSGVYRDATKAHKNAVWFWDARTGALQRDFDYEKTVETTELFPHQLLLLPDGNSFITTSGEGTVVQRSLTDGRLTREFKAAPLP